MLNTKSIDELLSENKLLHDILDNVNDAIYAVDSNGKIIVYNKAMERVEKSDRRYILGYNDREIYNSFSEDDYLRKEVIDNGAPIQNRRLIYQTANGYRVDMLANTHIIYEDTNINSIYCVIQDLSNIQKMQERIDFLSKLLKETADSNNDARTQFANGTKYVFSDIIGSHEKIQETIRQAKHIATSSSNVLIYGETGTGKELFSQSIHNVSNFKNGPFIAINCASIPSTLLESQLFGTVAGAYSDAKNMPGFFEQAENGTLFLDEINSMDINLQAKLLRVLQDKTICRLGDKKQRKINCRIICATNKNPMDPDITAYFREDLLYRLMTIVIFIPPLRERKEDIPELCEYFIKHLNTIYNAKIINFDEKFMNLLMNHTWPGNVRQLENLLESCICYLDTNEHTLKIDHIPSFLKKQFKIEEIPSQDDYVYTINENEDLNSLLNKYELHIIETTIKSCDGNISQAAKKLGLSRQNMNYRLRKFNIQTKDLKPPS